MSTRRILWLRIISGICILIGLIYLGASILVIAESIPQGVSRIFRATEALFIIYAICFIIGGIGLAFLRRWGREMLVTILWIDIVRETLVIIIPIISKLINIMNRERIYSPAPSVEIFQLVFYGILLLEIMMLFYISRKKIKELLVPKTENIPAA